MNILQYYKRNLFASCVSQINYASFKSKFFACKKHLHLSEKINNVLANILHTIKYTFSIHLVYIK